MLRWSITIALIELTNLIIRNIRCHMLSLDILLVLVNQLHHLIYQLEFCFFFLNLLIYYHMLKWHLTSNMELVGLYYKINFTFIIYMHIKYIHKKYIHFSLCLLNRLILYWCQKWNIKNKTWLINKFYLSYV